MNQVQQLFNIFQPKHYELSINIDHVSKTFTGTVTIDGSLIKDAGYIPLHAKEITISGATISGKTADISYHENDEIRLTQQDVIAGDYIATLEFSGTATDAMHGMYPAYFEHEGKKQHLIATQFESHHAREVFPCVDEPAAKSTYNVTITTDPDITVLGNMPVKSQSSQNGQTVTTFETTPKMSTYLLAWVSGNMHKKTATTSNGVEVNVWATPAQKSESLDFALDIATRTIDFYDDYFDTPYPLPKSDHVALPDFSSGAMENWGLVTYREIALLADPETTSISSKQYIATVIAHELAHQWFGNLVTMKWWNNLWLNESFATLMEYIAVDALHPEWDIWLDFASNESIMALRRDAIDGVQSVQMDVNHPDEISTLFDGAIVYAKGARLLHMLRQYIGDEAFKLGLKSYFEKHAYSNTEGDDLWNALSEASGKDIKDMMNTWISQPGYPVVTVAKDGQDITLTQEQFFIGDHGESSRLWPIPLNSTCSEMPEILSEKSITIHRHHTTPLLLNAGGASHFIRDYSPELLADLLVKVEDKTLSSVDRLSILNEAILLARAGKIKTAELLPILNSYKNETSEPVWGLISLTLSEFRKFVENNELAEKALRKLSGNIANAEYQRLGWNAVPGETAEDEKLRGLAISLTLYSEDQEAIETAKILYSKNGAANLNPELKSVILSSIVKNDTDGSITSELIKLYSETQDADLSQDICLGLTSTKSEAEILNLLENLKNPEVVRPQDVARWFAYLIRNRYARGQTWDWLKQNWGWIESTFGGDKSYDYFPQYAASGLVSRDQLEDYKAFFMPMLENPSLKRVITLGITEIEARVKLIESDGPGVIEALTSLQ